MTPLRHESMSQPHEHLLDVVTRPITATGHKQLLLNTTTAKRQLVQQRRHKPTTILLYALLKRKFESTRKFSCKFVPQTDWHASLLVQVLALCSTDAKPLPKPMMIQYTDDYCHRELTHWGRDKMAAPFQTTFSSAFSWMKMYKFGVRFHWNLFPSVQLIISQHWFR